MSSYLITDFGAETTADQNNASAIQSAIDAAEEAGGGMVIVPAGQTFTTGTLRLKAHVTLHLEPGSVLRASSRQEDFEEATIAGEYGGNQGGFLITAAKADGIALTGTGIIDGNGEAFLEGFRDEEGKHIRKAKPWRARGIGFFECHGLRVRDLTIRNCAQWTMHLTGCHDGVIDGISIFNGLDVPNCDGIDPDHCRNLRISNCHIEAGDDGIVLKNTKEFIHLGPSENIVIQNCTVISTSAAIKIGTESQGTFRDVLVNNCVIRKSHRGLAIQLRDNGTVERVTFSNCRVETRLFHPLWWGRAEPIYVTTNPRHDGNPAGKIRDIRFENIDCYGEHGVFISGCEDESVKDITLSNVRVTLEKTSKWSGGEHDRRPAHSEEHAGRTPGVIHGFYLDHVEGAELSHCAVRISGEPQEYYREGVGQEACEDVTIKSCRLASL